MQNAAAQRRGFAAPRLLDMPARKSDYNLLNQVPAGLPPFFQSRNPRGQHQLQQQQLALDDRPLNRSRAGCRRQSTGDRNSIDPSACIDAETLNYQGSKPKLIVGESCSFSSNKSRIPYAETRSPRARDNCRQLPDNQNFNVAVRDPEWAPFQRPGFPAVKPAHSSTDPVVDQGLDRGAPCAWAGERSSVESIAYGGRGVYSSSAGLQRQSSGSSFGDSLLSGDFSLPTLSATVSLNASDSAFFNALFDEGWKHDDTASNKQAVGSHKSWAQQTEESYNLQLTFALRLTAEASLTEELHFLGEQFQESSDVSSSSSITKSVEAASYRFWVNGSLSYCEKIQDGFYNIRGMNPHVWTMCNDWEEGGQMPSLESLRAVDASDSSMEVVLIDKQGDSHLRELENKALGVAYGCTSTNEVIEQLGKLVCMLMGGPSSTESGDLMMRWKVSSKMLRDCLNCIVIPIGSLSVGLCRHRALLFKALADIIDLPCRIARGCKYCGLDDGSSCLVQSGVDREYLVDLIGKPGALCDPNSIIHGPSSLLISSPLCIPEFKSSQVADEVKSLVRQYASDSKCLGVLFNNMGHKPQVAGQKGDSTMNSDTIPSGTVPPMVASVMASAGTQPVVQGADTTSAGDISMQKLAVKCPHEELTITMNKISAANEHKVALGINVTKDSIQPKLLSAVVGEPAKLRVEDNSRKDSENIDCQLCGKTKPSSEDYLQKSLLQAYKQRDVNAKPNDEECLEHKCLQVCKQRDVHGKVGDAECLKRMILQTQKQRDVQSKLEDSHQEMDKSKDGRLVEAEGVLSKRSDLELSLAMDGLEIPWEDLILKERIGAGSFGTVHHADWHGSDVAVKILVDQDFHDERLKEFLREVAIMKRLRHPNVVLFMGAVTKRPNLSIVTEYLPRGSLYRLLHRAGARELLDERRRLRMALDVAKGINYLHRLNPPIVHRDLKSPNLLVDKTWTVKVCDFGLSRFKANTFLSSKSAAGTPEWMAPEVLRDEPSNEKSDVYSFGVILWELVTMQQPWSGLSPAQVVGAVGFQNRRLLIPQDMNPTIATVVESCWANDPRQRPSFASIMESLKPLVKPPATQPNRSRISSLS